MPANIPVPVSGTRDFCIAMLKAKIEGMIRNEGDIVGFEQHQQRVGTKILAAKTSLLRLIEVILPDDDDDELYRLVLQHDDFGVHNMSVFVDEDGRLTITSVYDWEDGCIVPILLSEFRFRISGCDLDVEEDGTATVNTIRTEAERGKEQRAQNQAYSEFLLQVRRLEHRLFS